MTQSLVSQIQLPLAAAAINSSRQPEDSSSQTQPLAGPTEWTGPLRRRENLALSHPNGRQGNTEQQGGGNQDEMNQGNREGNQREDEPSAPNRGGSPQAVPQGQAFHHYPGFGRGAAEAGEGDRHRSSTHRPYPSIVWVPIQIALPESAS